MSRRLLSLVLVLCALPGATFCAYAAPERVQITVLSTTDLHGNIYPIDYFRDRPSPVGLAKLATLIHAARKSAPDALLLDCGDTIQGTPLAYYHNRINNQPPDPMMLAMNALGFHALTIGNHEFNFGLDVLRKAEREAQFPWLAANVHHRGTDRPAFRPYLIAEIQGVRVGILGLTTPGVPGWESPENYADLDFVDPVESARRWVRVLREEERVDLVIVPMHMGLEEDLTTGVTASTPHPRENAALAIAREVPGIDAILMAHTHRHVPALIVNDVLLAQAGRWGSHLIRLDLFVERGAPDAPWQLVARTAQSTAVTAETPADPTILELARPYHEATQAWLARPIARSARTLSAAEARLRDTAIIDLIQRVQLEAGQADVSFAASFNPQARLPAGDVTVRDIYGLYVYENTLVVVEMTGAQVKDALEHAARYFLPYEPGKSPGELIDPSIPGYNFDLAEGVEYTIDLRRPVGDRIVDLAFRGAPLAPDRRLRVAINNYRHNGGGGYTMFSAAPVVHRSSREIRDLIIEWVQSRGDIPTEPTGNWRLLPAP
jgi:2',3'-cyclic-nucleotide 2'-phosphodiesterase (5'-nucleotidase family)